MKRTITLFLSVLVPIALFVAARGQAWGAWRNENSYCADEKWSAAAKAVELYELLLADSNFSAAYRESLCRFQAADLDGDGLPEIMVQTGVCFSRLFRLGADGQVAEYSDPACWAEGIRGFGLTPYLRNGRTVWTADYYIGGSNGGEGGYVSLHWEEGKPVWEDIGRIRNGQTFESFHVEYTFKKFLFRKLRLFGV